MLPMSANLLRRCRPSMSRSTHAIGDDDEETKFDNFFCFDFANRHSGTAAQRHTDKRGLEDTALLLRLQAKQFRHFLKPLASLD
jgi:hypothetical protein